MNLVNESHHAVTWLVGKLQPPIASATFIAKGTYDLKPGGAAVPAPKQDTFQGDTFVDEDPTRDLRYSSDLVHFKPRTDLLVSGHAYAKRATTVRVAFHVGSFSKAIAVVGNRTWKERNPAPFEKIEISYENAFGGPGYDKNPIGRGYKQDRMPNLEIPNQLVTDPGSKPEPAGFGPIPLTWPQRMSKAGTYDKSWLKKRWPWFPEDFDWTFFNAAPADQQLAAHLRGDEKLRFENLHPQRAAYESALPGLRVLCFYAERIGPRLRLREVPMNLDTLWVDMDAEKLTLVWRGKTDLRYDDLAESDQLLVLSEPLQETKKPIEQYEDILLRKIGELPPEPAQTCPISVQAPEPAPASPAAPEVPSIDPDEKAAAALEAELQKQIGPLPSAPVPPAAPEDPIVWFADAQKQLAAIGEPPLPPLSPEFEEPESLRPEAPPPPSAKEPTSLDWTGVDWSGKDLKGFKAPGAILKDAKLAKADLSGADLTGAILAGADLSEANLEKALLKGADLTGARLPRANLSEAVLDDADLTSASLRRAKLPKVHAEQAILTRADLSAADLRGAHLKGADLSLTLLHDANLSEANLSEAVLEKAWGNRVAAEKAILTKLRAADARLGGANLKGVQGAGSIWQAAQLYLADLSGADLAQAEFEGANLAGAKLSKASLKSARMVKANLRGAEMLRTNLFHASLTNADLTGADLAESNCFEADFFGAAMGDARLDRANLKRALITP